MTQSNKRNGIVSSMLLAGVVSLAAAAPVFAGVCAADKLGANGLPGAATAPVGVTDTELAFIDLSTESVKLPDRRLRFRHMEIAPGGIVPLHDHADRPALIRSTPARSTNTAASARCRSRTRRATSPAISAVRHWWKASKVTVADNRRHRRQETRNDDGPHVSGFLKPVGGALPPTRSKLVELALPVHPISGATCAGLMSFAIQRRDVPVAAMVESFKRTCARLSGTFSVAGVLGGAVLGISCACADADKMP